MSLKNLKSAFSNIQGFENNSNKNPDNSGLSNIAKGNQTPTKTTPSVSTEFGGTIDFTTQEPNSFLDTIQKSVVETEAFNPTPLSTLPRPETSIFSPTPLSSLSRPELNEFGTTLEKSTIDPNDVIPTPTKSTIEPNSFGDTLEKTTVEPNSFGDTLEKTTVEPNSFPQSDVTTNLEEPDEFIQSDLVNLQSEFAVQQEPQVVDNIQNTYGMGFTPNRSADDGFSDFTAVDIPNLNFSNDQSLSGQLSYAGENVNFFGGDNSYYPSINPPISGFHPYFNQGGYSFGDGDLGNSQYIGVSTGTHTEYNGDITFENQSTIGNDLIDSSISGFAANFGPTGDTFGEGEVGNSKFVLEPSQFSLMTNLQNSAVNYFNDNDATGFTLSDSDTPFTSQFQGIDETALTFTKQPSLLNYDTHDVITTDTNTLTFTNQESSGVNFLDIEALYASGFTPNLNELSDTQFIGIDNDTNIYEATTDYYDSIHTRNPISDTFGGPVDFMSGLNSYYGEVNSDGTPNTGIPGFTNEFGLTETSLPGYNQGAGEMGISKFLKEDGTAIETGTHTMWGESNLTLESQINSGLSFFNKSSIYLGDDPSTEDVVEEDFTQPYARGFTPNLSAVDLTNSQFEGVNEDEGTYTARTSFHGGYNINTDNIDGEVDGTLFDPAEDEGQFGTSNVGLSQFPSKEVTLQSGVKIDFSSFATDDGNSFQYETLYNSDQTVTENKFTNGVKMGLKNDGAGDHPSQGPGGLLFGLSRGNEPYIIQETGGGLTSGDRIIPIQSAIDDTLRMADFVSSPQGIAFVLKENALGLAEFIPSDDVKNIAGNPYGNRLYDPTSLASGVQIGPVNFRLRRDYGPVAALADLLLPFPTAGESYPHSDGNFLEITGDKLKDKKIPTLFPTKDVEDSSIHKSNQQKSMSPFENMKPENGVLLNNNLLTDHLQTDSNYAKYDSLTIMDTQVADSAGVPIDIGNMMSPDTQPQKQIEEASKEKHGMPLYFRDMRDGRALIFRAYITGLNESFSPNWSSENYIGRSEPVYIYSGGTEREIGFSLKLIAQSAVELTAIYEKLNRLTSLLYPEYVDLDVSPLVFDAEGNSQALDIGSIASKTRMKPPLTKFRLGELYGAGPIRNKEVTGFIKSLSYTFPDESPWETRRGYRVPKYIDVELGYQVIHDEVPSLAFAKVAESGEQQSFYGINQFNAPFKTSGKLAEAVTTT